MPTEAKKQIAFVLYPGLTPLDLIGPLQALSAVPRVDPTYEVMVVAETPDTVLSDSIISLGPSHTFDHAPSPFAIVVPGGGDPTLRAAGHKPLVDYVTEAGAHAEIVMSVCTGAIILATAGLLERRRATTHWAYVDVLENLGVDVVRARWVEDDKYVTTAGVSAGIDGGIHLAQRLLGDDVAKLIQLGMQYEPEPPLGPIDWDPAITEAVRPIWRPPLEDILAAHPHLDRRGAFRGSGHSERRSAVPATTDGRTERHRQR
jgi:transcriptional regulator GlxA family with amidase domain